MKERLEVLFVDCEEEDLSSRTGAQFYLGKRTGKIEHEEIGKCAGIEISQDANNADQKVKSFPKVHKTYKLLREAYFSDYLSPSFYSHSYLKFFDFHLPENESLAQKLIEIAQFSIAWMLFL